MMRQEINLYKKLIKSKPSGALLSWRQCWLGNFMFFLFLAFICMIMQVNVYFLFLKEQSLIQTINVLQAKFLEIKSHYPNLFFSDNVAKAIDDLQKELDAGEKFLYSISNNTPISSYLSLLANTILPDIWLTNIKISDGGDQILLKGNSLTVPSVQQFLQVLVSQKSFSGYLVGINDISSPTVDDEIIKFEILMTKKTS